MSAGRHPRIGVPWSVSTGLPAPTLWLPLRSDLLDDSVNGFTNTSSSVPTIDAVEASPIGAGCANFVPASNQFLEFADNTLLDPGTGDFFSYLDTTNASSAMFIQTQVGNVNNVTIQGNYLRGRGYNLVLSQDSNRFPYSYSNIVATNNRFTPESFGAVSIDGGAGFASFTNNFIYSASAPDNRGAAVLL